MCNLSCSSGSSRSRLRLTSFIWFMFTPLVGKVANEIHFCNYMFAPEEGWNSDNIHLVCALDSIHVCTHKMIHCGVSLSPRLVARRLAQQADLGRQQVRPPLPARRVRRQGRPHLHRPAVRDGSRLHLSRTDWRCRRNEAPLFGRGTRLPRHLEGRRRFVSVDAV